MKQASLILSIIATCLAGVLLYLHIKEKQPARPSPATAAATSGKAANPFAIAYFDMDSLENNYQYYKDALNVLKTKENGLNTELSNLARDNQKKIAEWQQKGNTMSQAEAEAANKEYQQMQQKFVNRKQDMEQTMENLKRDEMSKLRKKLEDFLKEYNKDKRYDYIFSYAPEFMFFKDTIYNITPDLIKGLNEQYKGKN